MRKRVKISENRRECGQQETSCEKGNERDLQHVIARGEANGHRFVNADVFQVFN